MSSVQSNFTIMIAEDDGDDLFFITDALHRSRFTGAVASVADGGKLLQSLRQPVHPPGLPGLILLDLNMPYVDGYEALREIKRDPTLRRIPTIVLTSATSREEEQRCYALGAERFYRKPVSVTDYDQVAAGIVDFIQEL